MTSRKVVREDVDYSIYEVPKFTSGLFGRAVSGLDIHVQLFDNGLAVAVNTDRAFGYGESLSDSSEFSAVACLYNAV